MSYFYEIETRNDTIEYELEPTYEEIKSAIIEILSRKNANEIYSILTDIADAGADLEEYFYDELKEYFKEIAQERYKDSEQEKLDYYYDYYHDKI